MHGLLLQNKGAITPDCQDQAICVYFMCVAILKRNALAEAKERYLRGRLKACVQVGVHFFRGLQWTFKA